jgi:hypothetical protein
MSTWRLADGFGVLFSPDDEEEKDEGIEAGTK